MNAKKPTIIDLFAGVGGLSLGAVRAGFSLPLIVEFDKHAVTAHAVNFPNTKHLEVDISSLTGTSLLESSNLTQGDLDGLIGGPPCQGFSPMGHRSADDPRNNLFVKFFELVSECKPRFFLVENVPGILHDKYKEIRDKAFGYVEKEYKLSEPIKLKASDFGAPTNRERIFFIGCRNNEFDLFTAEDFADEKHQTQIKVGTALRGLPTEICSTWLTEEDSWRSVQCLPESEYSNSIQGNIPDGVGNKEAINRYLREGLVSGCFGTRHSPEVQERYRQLEQGEKDPVSKAVRLKTDGFCPTLRAGTGPDRGSYQAVRPIHPTEPRVITPREAARLQGFPDWFQFAPSKWHSFRQIGNSVSPILAESIFKVIFTRYYSISGE